MNDQIDIGETGDARFVPENATNDILAEDGSTIRHRLVYVRDRPYEASASDLRIHALQQAGTAYSNSDLRFSRKTDEGEEQQPVEDIVIGIADKFHTWLTQD